MIDYKDIKEQFDKIITYSQGIENPKTDHIFETWEKNKSKFYHYMGEKLIYEYPEEVSFDLGDKEKHEKVIQFANDVFFKWRYEELSAFIDTQEEGFFKNITTIDYIAPNGKNIKKGTKLIKAFKYFINNEKTLKMIQNEASKLIQENKISGKLCLSIHPLDYLSVSENIHNWRSCHSLDGEFRAGNLSYMMDPSTIICYLKSDNECELPNFPSDIKWNSKKWRVLLFISKDNNLIVAGKQYPFSAQTIIDTVLKDVLLESNLIQEEKYEFWSNWIQSIYDISFNENKNLNLHDKYIMIEQKLVPISKMIHQKCNTPNEFNDILKSTTYKPIYAFKIIEDYFNISHPRTTINSSILSIGDVPYCLHCGERRIESGGGTMRCVICESEYGEGEDDYYTYCDGCGQRIRRDDAWWVEDECLCDHCSETMTNVCESCGENLFNEHLVYDEQTNCYYCYNCYNDLVEERRLEDEK